MKCNICVVGAGVIGLSTAVNIVESLKDPGISVHLIADKLTPHTTSDGSGGLFEPYYLADNPIQDMLRWARITYEHTTKLSQQPTAADSGNFLMPGYYMYTEEPYWKDIVYGFRRMSEPELQQFGSKYKCGFSFTSTITECKKYLPWLTKRFTSQGGEIFQKRVHTLQELSDAYNIVLNCSGLDSYNLVSDHNLNPIRGQVIRVRAPWIKMFLITDDAYIIPNTDTVVLGGTYGVGEWDKTVNAKDKAMIWEECVKLCPSLQKAEYVSDWVGLRPARTRVRLEAEKITLHNNKTLQVIHNYGHAGCGVSLHWGCAVEATQLVKKAYHEIVNNKAKL